MKLKYFILYAIMLFIVSISLGQTVEHMPDVKTISKDYRSDYKKQLKKAVRLERKSSKSKDDDLIQIDAIESVPTELISIEDIEVFDFSNYGKPMLVEERVMHKLVRSARFNVFLDVYDTGIDEDHPDMQNGKVQSRDGINEGAGDGHGHGSHVWSTTMGERGGVIYELVEANYVTGRATKCLNRSGSGSFRVYSDLHKEAFDDTYKDIVDNGGFVVTNSSLGANTGQIGYVNDALKIGYDYGGIMHVAAAGNSNSDVDFPGSSPYTIGVGAVDINVKRAGFSCYGENLDVVAPGVGIKACWKDGNYSSISGTSMSSPFVTGWVVAAYSVWGDKLRNGDKLRAYLHKLSTDAGQEGFDDYYGHGLAVLNMIPDVDPDSINDPNPDPDPPVDPDPDPPVNFDSSVFFEISGLEFRYNTHSDPTFRTIKVDDLRAVIKCDKCTEEQAYDMGNKAVDKYFRGTYMQVPDTPNFGYKTVSEYIGLFLKYNMKQNNIDLELATLKGIDDKGRNAIVTDFKRSKMLNMMEVDYNIGQIMNEEGSLKSVILKDGDNTIISYSLKSKD